MDFKLGDTIGFKESLEHEFKEFVLKVDYESYVEYHEIKALVSKGIIPTKFNEMIKSNICYYFYTYLPKYISAFSNCEDLEAGYLYFGINNSGEITGIPFEGELTPDDIHTIIETIPNFLSVEGDKDETILEEFLRDIKIEVIKLEKNMDYLTDESGIELEYKLRKYQEYCKDYEEFKIVQSKWIEELNSFTNKISYIALDKRIRSEIASYIRTNVPHRENCALILESDQPIEVLNGVRLNDYKASDDNVYYWIMFYKDMISKKIRERRPNKPVNLFGDIEYIHTEYFRLLTKLRYKLISENFNMNYYLIRIKIPSRKECKVYYRHPVYDYKWLAKIRSNGSQGPCCL